MSNNILQHLGKIQGGKFVSDNPLLLQADIKKLEGKRVSAVFKTFREYKQRSIQQGNYYWGVICSILSDETGNDPETIHEVIKSMFLVKEVELKGKKFTGAASTASLSTAEFEALCSKVRAWASSELSVYIPAPNEPDLVDFL